MEVTALRLGDVEVVQTDFLRVVETLYSGVLEESKWEEAVHEMTRHVGGHAAFHLAVDPRTATITSTSPFGVSPEMVQRFKSHFTDKDVRVPAGLSSPVGKLLVDYDLVEMATMRRSEIFNDLLVPFDIPYLMALWLKKSATSFVSFSIEASLKHGPFQRESVERFRRVIPHLMRVTQARELLSQARISKSFYEHVMHNLPFGMLMLDEHGGVLEATPLAEDVLREGTTLQCNRRFLRALNAKDDQELQAAIGAAGRPGVNGVSGQTLTLRRSTHMLPLTLIVLPVVIRELLVRFPRPAGLVLILDPERKVRAKVELMQRSLLLSHAEATLALTLLQGVSLQQAAAQLKRSYNTCKTQMKAIYAKSGCESQVDLVKKMMLIAFASQGDADKAE